jgi:3-deoxy-D-arabino-heptulosonate 7-phosphate (DAHP) synthase
LSDAAQQLDFGQFAALAPKMKAVTEAVGRRYPAVA